MEEQLNEKATYLNILVLIFSKPRIAFKLILEKDETMFQYIILGIFGFLNAITPILIHEPMGGVTLFKLIFKGLMGGAFGWIGIWFLSHLINLTNNILKAETEFEDVFFIFSFSFCPMILSFLLILILNYFIHSLQIFPLLTALLIFVGYIWTICLLFIGNKLLSKGNWIKNTIALLIPLLLILGLNIFFIKMRV